MKLIIDIPKGTYEAITVGTINQVLEYKVWNAIKNATPLSAEGEYIKKEDIVKYIDNMPSELTEDGRRMVRQIRLKEFVADLPTYSFPEREKGEWIKIQSGDKDFPESIVCSKCKNENSHLDFNEHSEPIGKVFVTSNFCPNCGADMRGNTDAER